MFASANFKVSKIEYDPSELENLILSRSEQTDEFIKQLFVTRVQNDGFAYYSARMYEDEKMHPYGYALTLISDKLEKLGNPLEVLRFFAEINSYEIHLTIGSIIWNKLRKIVELEIILKFLLELDIERCWAIHYAGLLLFRIEREWFLMSENAYKYIDNLFRNSTNLDLRDRAFDEICRLFPYDSTITKKTISDALEDESEYIRALARSKLELWFIKDNAVNNFEKSRSNQDEL